MEKNQMQTLITQNQTLEEALRCPRCDSTNTKFCYYNNYNLAQPRHFCKNCRRYWTKGGALRNIPVGGGTRRGSKRAAGTGSSTITSTSASKRPAKALQVSNDEAQNVVSPSVEPVHDQNILLDMGLGSFSTLLATNGGNYGSFQLDGGFLGGHGALDVSSSVDSSGNEGLWTGRWGDLSIYTPGPTFQ
ncbi:hypothetical protein LUZ60_012315 [Juncus effusus]|nr:hypothetical protein LUZ60_012315 [Juncus effusus]